MNEMVIPDCKINNWAIETFEVTKDESVISTLRLGIRFVPPGIYKKLVYKRCIVMSNTPAEIRDHYIFIRDAKGHILINGLGLGVCIFRILEKEFLAKENYIKSITVIEKAKEVIQLVSPFIKDDRVLIYNADAFEWKPPKNIHYDFVWHDIWNDICTDNLFEMHKLHRKYGKKANWQGSWSRSICEYYKKRRK